MRSLASFTPANRSPVPLARRYERTSGLFSRRYGRADTVREMEVYGEDAVVYPIVRRLAEATAKHEWKLFRKSKSGLKDDRVEVTDHAVLDLWNQPNKFMNRMQFMEHGQQHSDLTGETNIVIGRLAGIKYPIDLWPVRPDRLTPVPDPYEYLAGWLYQFDGERIPLEPNEIMRHILPSPLDLYRGMGPMQALMRDLDAQRYGKEWQASFFENSARPGGILEVDRRLGDDEFDELRERWNEQHKGLSKAHRVAIVEGGLKWTETAFSLRDLQMAELDTISRDKALVAFGFPKPVLGIVEDVNRANAEAGEYLFAKWLIEPRLDRWKGMLNGQLLPLFDPNLNKVMELDYVSPVPENSEQALREIDVKSRAFDLLASKVDTKELTDWLGIPDLKYTAPPPPTVIAPPAPGAPPADPAAPVPPAKKGKQPPVPPADAAENAMRWEAVAHQDDSTCEPCKENNGKTYRNRESAYADYPGGKGYIKCVGAEFGNTCRCSVKKRRGQ